MTPTNTPGANLIQVVNQTAALVVDLKIHGGLTEQTAVKVVELGYKTVQNNFDNQLRTAELEILATPKED